MTFVWGFRLYFFAIRQSSKSIAGQHPWIRVYLQIFEGAGGRKERRNKSLNESSVTRVQQIWLECPWTYGLLTVHTMCQISASHTVQKLEAGLLWSSEWGKDKGRTDCEEVQEIQGIQGVPQKSSKMEKHHSLCLIIQRGLLSCPVIRLKHPDTCLGFT